MSRVMDSRAHRWSPVLVTAWHLMLLLALEPSSFCSAAVNDVAITTRVLQTSVQPVRPEYVSRLRGGGRFNLGLEDTVTPEDIREIGGDVLKMWQVNYQETVEEEKFDDAKKGKTVNRNEQSGEEAKKELQQKSEGPEQDRNDLASAQGEIREIMYTYM